ncbi:DUF5689 domain-containing protein [Flavivirga spongiicola]|uniref:DUF5689 domain-containing protein n=1 Tax=Flavivirga spongiicola TaxID=421621 RepID=A0ABU7XS19_9FLAO|nr:DUF5689 domain-containing protein [Flavivirga sp. MEBiC05379]MDO5978592.1 DUF5689 domain-containing protein [Flavivirga sp. MEBiC05379]
MNYRNRLLILNMVILFFSCVDEDHSIPSPDDVENIVVPVNQLTTFKAIYERYEQAKNKGELITVINEDLYIEGYVISSDRAGNFFEELIIQNKVDESNPDNDPRLGIKLEINVGSLSDSYELGRKVYVKLKGLTIGESNGVLAIGRGEDSRIEQIQDFEYQNIVLRTSEVVTITPKISSLIHLTEADENTLIQLDNMQVNRFDLALTYAGESTDAFDGLRILENCESGASILLQTSTFSDFKSLPVPQNKGSIRGVFSRDYRDNFNVLIVSSSSDITFDSDERCDPMELDCGLAPALGTMNLFYEDFESQKNNKLIAGNGWTNYIEAGSEGWEAYSSTSTNASLGRSARFKSASSGDASNVGWLITPAINLDTQDGETLRFKTSNSLADSSYLEVLYALDWDGTEANINSANWGVLTAAYIVKDTDSFVPWFNSGNVDLSCVTGTIHIAFKYTGSGQEIFDGVYELDAISIDYLP